MLAGANLASLTRILSGRGALSPRSYAQIAIIFAGAVLRWPGCVIEALRVARRAQEASFDPPPVFIVGHWRSGTTLLHNLLSRDPGFCFPTIVDVLRPYDFYPNPLDFVTRRIVLRFLPPTRPMDDVRIDPESPQEEELALATMGAPSFFNCIYFPKEMTSVFAEEVLFAGADDKTLRTATATATRPDLGTPRNAVDLQQGDAGPPADNRAAQADDRRAQRPIGLVDEDAGGVPQWIDGGAGRLGAQRTLIDHTAGYAELLRGWSGETARDDHGRQHVPPRSELGRGFGGVDPCGGVRALGE